MPSDPKNSPFPHKLCDGKVWIDELCRCGANRSEHEDGYGGAYGHGHCVRTNCDRFRFKRFVYGKARRVI